MQKMSMLILTDHSAHSSENAIYALAQALRTHPACRQLDIASRGITVNNPFFLKNDPSSLWAVPVEQAFRYTQSGFHFKRGLRKVDPNQYDAIFLRLPYPVEKGFWVFLNDTLNHPAIINHPIGIETTSSKMFLTSVSDLCPPINVCRTKEDVLSFSDRFPIVLKPARNYGGKGIVKIENQIASLGDQEIPLQQFFDSQTTADFEYLGMKFLKNVSQGDKRIIVVDGQVLGASLRVPAQNSWLCNVSQGGHSVRAEADADELHIAARLSRVLSAHGIVFFGFDTLVNDEGKRVLSEINTMSIGGLPQIGQQTGRPVVQEAAALLWNYVKKTVYGSQSFAA